MNTSQNATVTRTVFTGWRIAWDFCILLAGAAMAGMLIGFACLGVVALLATAGA
jgi:uncharacterized integral membrane protein